MGNYMTSAAPKTDFALLRQEILRLGEDYEVEFSGPEGGALNLQRCLKNPGHQDFIPIPEFSLAHLPAGWKDPKLHGVILSLARRTVNINVGYVSPKRPKEYFLSTFGGKQVPTTGSGYGNISSVDLSKAPIECPLPDCPLPRPHPTTSVFKVTTAKHVVYDDLEARYTTVEFFYDSNDRSTVISCQVLSVTDSFQQGDGSVLNCVAHDLSLFKRVCARLPPPPFRPPLTTDPTPPLVVIASHPHGCEKRLSIGNWVGYQPEQDSPSEFNSLKLTDILSNMEQMNPLLRTTGFQMVGGHVSPDRIQQLYTMVRHNPEITWGDVSAGELSPDRGFGFVTYNAPTCPGTSGARIYIFTKLPNGEFDVLLSASHFRHRSKRSSASGIVSIDEASKARVQALLPSLRKVKRK